MRRFLHFFGIHHWSSYRLYKGPKWVDIDDFLEKKNAKKLSFPHERMVRRCNICHKVEEKII